MKRGITGYYQDDLGDWVATLNCGHKQHVRHQPPFFERPWVMTETGRQEKIGSELHCVRCDASEWPVGLFSYKKTEIYDQNTLPKGLLKAHRTKTGIWALIHCKSGRLKYIVGEPICRTVLLDSHQPGIVIPEVVHRIEPEGEIEIFIEFFRQLDP